ncbi:MAG TPA: S-methyl-5'-thioinosine phosphorylase [Woeseiaceae bacterium]|nr:S-methyl-5'-thioinosine phosphorylase [Woeseiaceae bacterium]
MTEDSGIAVIGGSGLERMPGVEVVESRETTTPFGPPSAALVRLSVSGQGFWFLSRHGAGHDIAPHRVNYRANLWALDQLGVTRVVAVNAVGVVPAEPPLGSLAVPDQVIDYTWGRESTFFDGESAPLEHADFTEPYAAGLRQALIREADALGIPCRAAGVYGVTQGPRLETRAEVDRLAGEGVDYIGMTGMPEAVLARELALEYACLAVLVNRAAGRGEVAIHADLEENLMRGAEAASRVALALIAATGTTPEGA